MTRSPLALARLAAPPAGPDPPDAHLLRAFVAGREDDPFAELVRRHGPMVLAACRRVLGDPHDADDAFQATFLVLARKANSVRGNLAGWLHAVAVRTARGVRVMRDRRRKHELRANPGRERRGGVAAPDPDLAVVIDEELAKLPAHYREAVVVCELRGLSRKQAAAELGVPEGTLSSRLAAAKRKLAALLAARGLAAPAVLVLAPVTVSAGLVSAAVAAARGAAGPVAGAAASAVVKAMLFDQLKAVTLAAGILLTAVCGGLAMTGTPGDQPGPAVAPAPRPADHSKLVGQLGSPEFTDREAAAKRLRELGREAEAALKAGLKSENPEVRERAARLLTAIRADARDRLAKAFDPAPDAPEPDHPLWKRFKSVAGNDPPARKLFAELIASPHRLKLLDDADRDPDRAGDLYAAELERWYAWMQALNNPPAGRTPPKDAPESEAVAIYPVAVTIMYLGTYPSSAGKAKEGWRWEGHLFIESWDELVKSPVGPAVRRIFAAWLPVRGNTDAEDRGLAIATAHRIREAVPFARKVVADEKEVPLHRAQAALLLGVVGSRTDLALLRRVAESEPANKPFDRFNVVLKGQQELDALWARVRFGEKVDPEESKRIWKEADVRTCDRTVADCAWAAAVRLAGGKPEDLGFCWSRTVLGRDVTDYWFGIAHIHGFPDDKSRAAAHAKAKEFLDKLKDEPMPAPAVLKLVEQLGSPEFADREAAAKRLRELGVAGEAALKAGLRSENPEVRARAAKLLTLIRADARDALVKGFDPAKEEQPDHPVWRRFKSIAGDTRASRDLFAAVIKNADWLRRLDAAEATPAAAAFQYREAIAEVGKHYRSNMSVTFEISVWPCDRGEEAAYLLLLGSHPGTAPDPATLSEPEARLFADGEARIYCGKGLALGLQGKQLEAEKPFRPDVVKAPDGTDRVFARLLAGWLPHRTDPDSLWGGFRLAAAHDAPEVLPFARRAAADKTLPVSGRCYALMPVARFGTPADLPLFEALGADETVIAVNSGLDIRSAPGGAGPAGPIGKVQARDFAAGHALLLFGENPAAHGFVQVRDNLVKPGERPDVARFLVTDFAFPTGDDGKARADAHTKAKAWLDEQKPAGKKDGP